MNDKTFGIILIICGVSLIAITTMEVALEKCIQPDSFLFLLGMAGIITGILLIKRHNNEEIN